MEAIVLIAIAVAIAAVIGTTLIGMTLFRRKNADLEHRYGREYERTVKREGRRKAEAELIRREARVSAYDLRALDDIERNAFSDRWTAIQAEFVDAPRASLQHADVLLQEVMVARGYPMADFEQRVADLSVEYGELVTRYRSAQSIAQRAQTASTEELRQALLLYRSMFENLTRVAAPVQPEEATEAEVTAEPALA